MIISKKFISILTGIILISASASAYCQQTVQTISGSVSTLNISNKSFSINYTDQTNTIQNIQFVISEDTEFFDLSDIFAMKIGDDISIDYIIDDSGNNLAVSVYKFSQTTVL